jgi:hypothetical protein
MSQATLDCSPVAETAGRQSLYAVLASVRRRLLAIGLVAALGWALASAAMIVLGGMWLDLVWELNTQTRIAVWLFAGAVAAILLAIGVIATLGRLQHAAVARRVDAAAGNAGDVLAGLELDRHDPNWQPLTAGMAKLAVERAGRVASQVAIEETASARPAMKAVGSLAGIGLIVVILAILFPRLTSTQWERFTAPSSDTPPFTPLVFTVAPGDYSVRYGSGLEITASATGAPVERMELVLNSSSGEEVLPMFPEANGQWRAVLTKVLDPTEYFVRAQRGRSSRYKISVITVPRIENLRVRVTPPAYTNRPPYDGPIPKEGLSGLPGAKVEIVARSNRPLSGGNLRLVSTEAQSDVPLAKGVEKQEAVGQFTIERSGRFELSVRDVAGEESAETVAGTITLLHDDRPLVRILKPPQKSMATPNVDLPIEMIAEDDYGVSRLALFRNLNDSRSLPQEIPLPSVPPTRHGVQIALPLAEYGLRPGDVIKMFARVEDNDPAGAKGFESPVVTVQIISQEEFERMIRMEQGLEMLVSKYRAAERNLESLQNKVEGLKKKAKEAAEKKDTAALEAAQKELREELSRLKKETEADAESLRSAAKNMLPYDLDQELTPELDKLAKEMDEQAKQLEELMQEEKLSPEKVQEAIEKLSERLGKQREQIQKEATEPLEELERLFPLISAGSRFMVLVEQQADLADRLSNLKNKDGQDDPATKVRMRELQEEQAANREELSDLLKDIEENVAKLPEKEEYDSLRQSAQEFVDNARESGAEGMMNDAETALSEFSGTKGSQKSKEAADALMALLNQCNGMCDNAGNKLKFAPGLGGKMGRTLKQLLGEMGLGDGTGGGQGSGYSMKRGGNTGMGLYGEFRGHRDPLGGAGRGRENFDGGSGRSGQNPDQTPAISERHQTTEAGSAGDPAIPLPYRKRVGQYFQRLAEELGDTK